MSQTVNRTWVLPADAPADWNPVADLYAERNWEEYHEQTVMVEAIAKYCYWIPTPEALQAIGLYGPIISIGAGTGYAENLLRLGGIEVVAVDHHPTPKNPVHWAAKSSFGELLEGDESMIEQYPGHTLMLAWPYGNIPMVSNCLHLYTGKYLVWIGQESGRDGQTGDPKSHQTLARDWVIERLVQLPNWIGRHDELRIYRRL